MRILLPFVLFALLAPVFAGPPPDGAPKRLAEQVREFRENGWSARGHLRVSDAKKAEAVLAVLETEIDPADLPEPDRLDLRLLRHRLAGLLEDWRELDLEHRDIAAWLPDDGEINLAFLQAGDDPEKVSPLFDRLEASSKKARAALADADREDSHQNDEALDHLASLVDERWSAYKPLARPPLPAFTELRRFASQQKKQAPPRAPDRARELRWLEYVHYFRWDVGIDDSPADILALGKRLYRETEDELAAVAKKLDASKSWREIAEDLRLDHPDAEGLLGMCRAEMERAIAFTKKEQFVTVPEWATHVRAEWGGPDDRTPYGHYNPCEPSDPELKGTYVVSPVTKLKGEAREEVLRGNNRPWIRVVSLHEAIPGHHLQFAIAARRTREVPKWFYNPSYVEGWGLYCEELMYRHGYYDDRTRLSQLKMRLWRCARVVIDVGCNFGGMTKEEGVRLLVEGVGMEKPSAEMEVTRYLASPGYYAGYIVGRDRFERLFASEKNRLGAKFDERDFHDRLLGLGPIPFDALERAMEGR
ncbi:MAG: DUF885 domain-containing protein [Planctomycetes bacterium]|nr:DUF885 domain-containing protein [Planctomycetota bacterium]